jgi:MFS family permease
MSARKSTFRLQLTVALAAIFAPLNSTMLAVGLPTLRDEFEVGVGAITFLVSAYLIAVAVIQPAGGRLGDAFGHARVLRVGLVTILAASLAAAFSPSFGLLVTFRSLQGVAAALIMPNAIACLRRGIQPARLPGALGFNGAALSGAAACGPLLGGLLLALDGWELLFLVNLPLALAALGFSFGLPRDEAAGRAALKLDVVSLATLLAGFAGLTLAANAIRGGHVAVIASGLALLVAAVALYGFRHARGIAGVVDLRLFSRRNFAAPAAANALTNLVMYTTLISMPIYLHDVRGLGSGSVSAALFATSAAVMLISPLTGVLVASFGSRRLIVAGSLILLASPVGLFFLVDGAPFGLFFVFLGCVGVAMACIGAPQQAIAIETLSREETGSGAGTYQMMRYVGSVSGTALLAALAGPHPGVGEFQSVFAVLAFVAVASLFVSALVRPGARRPATGPSPATEFRPSPAGSSPASRS